MRIISIVSVWHFEIGIHSLFSRLLNMFASLDPYTNIDYFAGVYLEKLLPAVVNPVNNACVVVYYSFSFEFRQKWMSIHFVTIQIDRADFSFIQTKHFVDNDIKSFK